MTASGPSEHPDERHAEDARLLTRVAAGEENLWVGIMLANARHTAAGLLAVERRAAELRTAIEANDIPTLRRLLAEARIARQNLDRSE
jgi:prephenate dehydrogenase